MAHKDLVESGLAKKFQINHLTSNSSLLPFMGRKVRYKREILTADFIRANGALSIDGIFFIQEAQVDYKGEPCLRGYRDNDPFGRVLYPYQIEVVG